MFSSNRYNSLIKFYILPLLIIVYAEATLILEKTSGSQATIIYPLKKGEQTHCFGVTVHPSSLIDNKIFYAKNSGTISNLQLNSAGWMGNRYIQWFSFTSEIDKDDTIKIVLMFNTSILKTSNIANNSGPIVNLPLINSPKPSIKRSTLPSHKVSYGIRIDIAEDGIYKLNGEELKSLGVPINSIDDRFFKLYCKNVEVPIFISGSDDGKIDSEDALYFYGKFLRGKTSYYTSYSYDNVYWLTWTGNNPGLRFAEVSGGSEKDPDDYANIAINQAQPFNDTIHVEKDNDIRWLGDLFDVSETDVSPSSADTIDNWYWGFAGDKQLTHFIFDLPSPSQEQNNTCKLKVALGGLSNLNDLDFDHNFSIHLNDDPTGIEALWDGQSEIIVEGDMIPASRIKNGENIITLIKNHPDSIPDRIAINWFEFIYSRNFSAQNDKLLFKTTKDAFNKLTYYTLTNFNSENIDLWDISNYRKFKNINVTKNSKKYTVSFYDSLSSKGEFVAISESQYLTPAKIRIDTIRTDIFNISPKYIMISTDTLLKIMQPLAQYYIDQGLNVSTIDIEDIYNTFSYGIHNPESIREAVKYIYARNSNNPPQYLLLGGDASHDMDKQKKHLNIVPTHLSRTPNWGPSADDGYFTKVNGDDNFMDLQVGRLPAEGPEDMKVIIDKTVNYLKYPEHNQWRDNMILAGGFENNFTKFNNEAVSSIIDNKFNVYRLDADPNSSYFVGGSSASDLMAGYINSGVYFINFLGHGGGNVWSDSKLFSYSDLEKLHNSRWSTGGRLPIIFSFTCLTGFFESVFYQSLGEEFLKNSNDGAISFYGAAGYTRRNIDIALSRTLMQNGFSGSFTTLGELTNATEIMMLAQNEAEALPLINQYNLLGDPAIPWNPAKKITNITLSKKQHLNNDTLNISGTTNFAGNGKASIKIISESSIWNEKITDVVNSSFSAMIPLKEKSSTAQGIIRTFAWNDSSIERGMETFSKDAFALYDLKITPSIPIAGNSVEIECRIDLLDSTESPIVQCLYTVGDPAEEFYNFSDSSYVFMIKDSSTNKWISSSPIIVPEDNITSFSSPHLILQFKSTGSLGISSYHTFKIKGIADLEILESNCEIKMIEDSLKLFFSILNSGTESAYNPSILFLSDTTDTLYSTIINDTINAGETYNCTTTVTDLNGSFTVTGEVNHLKSVSESDFTNNKNNFIFKISFKDLLVPTDTLSSFGKGLLINPQKNLSAQRRIFLFYDSLNDVAPLLSNSKFNSTGNDGFMSFKIKSRPALSSTDSLKLTFFVNNDSINDSTNYSSIFVFNEIDSLWSFADEDRDTTNEEITIIRQADNFLAPATYFDKTGPQIRAYVNGKEVIYVDYIAKGMPFNIIFSDTSGINPKSISLLINGSELTSEQVSTTSRNENTTSLTVTAYPPEMNNVDTLSVFGSDLAGNETRRDFIYRPGKKLDIKFFSCHPNPFAARKGDVIRFAYLLTDVATNVEMTIYTIAGRRVWKWKNERQLSGYQEISWDGTTMNDRLNGKGFRLANGTYYAKLIAKNSERKVEKIIRIAKLEGY